MSVSKRLRNVLLGISISLFLLFLFSCRKENETVTPVNQEDTIIPPYNNQQVMSYGDSCIVTTPIPQRYKNDVLHPSVVYISTGFGGHKWWMVQSPYYNCSGPIENPIIYYANETMDGSAPKIWIPAMDNAVIDAPLWGYNSDPNLFYENGKLWLLWRENDTEDCRKNNYRRAVFGTSSKDGVTWDPSAKKLFMGARTLYYDSAMCPILIKDNDVYKVYASNFEFQPNRISHGLAIWSGHSLENPDFKVQGIYPIYCYNSYYQPWHFDILKYSGKYYMILQTRESNGNISLGESYDGKNFQILPKPLIVQDCKHFGIYKPTAVIKDGILYVYYTIKDVYDFNHNKLYITKMSMRSAIFDAFDYSYKRSKFSTNIRFRED